MTALASAGAWLATWIGRANNAWGASRVWNSGVSFETDLATWLARANNAWGASRVWGTGEAWEAAYNRVLPSGVHVLAAAGATSGTNSGTLATVTVDRSGYWYSSFAGTVTGGGGEGPVSYSLSVTGVGGVANGSADAGGSGSLSAYIGLVDPTPRFVAAGGTIYVTYSLQGGGLSGTVYAGFVPTPSYP